MGNWITGAIKCPHCKTIVKFTFYTSFGYNSCVCLECNKTYYVTQRIIATKTELIDGVNNDDNESYY